MNIFRTGIAGVPAPFVLGGLWMLLSGIIMNVVFGITGAALLLGSLGVGALIIIGGFTYGRLMEVKEDNTNNV